MTLTKIDDRGLKTPIDLLDNEKIRLGTHNDLHLYHDTNDSWIEETGTGNFYIGSNGAGTNIGKGNASGFEASARFVTDGAVKLYYDGSTNPKFETTSTGVDILGSDTTGSNLNGDLVINNAAGTRYAVFDASHTKINFSDNAKITLGDSNDLEIYHDGVNRIVGSGNLILQSPDIFFKSLDGNTTYASIDSTGKIDLNASVAKFGNSHSTATTYLYGHDIRFTNAGITTTTMTIDGAAGNVGIGSTSPGYRLDVRKDSTTAYSASASPSNVIARIQNGSAQTNSHSSLLLTATNDNGAVDFWWMSCVSQSTNYDGFLAFTGRTSSGASQELVRFQNNGDVDINAGNLNFASSKGIDFSAISDGSRSVTSNVFNDYEEGTWSPTVGTGASISSTTSARYTKVGRMVHYQFYINVGSSTSTASFSIGGLPYTAANYSQYYYGNGRVQNATHVSLQIDANSTGGLIYVSGGTTLKNNVASGNYILFSGVYEAA